MKFNLLRSARLAAVATMLTAGVAVAQPMSSSAAAPLAAGITCKTTLSFPGNGSSSCDGQATGIANGAAAVLTPFHADFNYSEPCPPVLGSATNGRYSAGAASGGFTWTRVGLTAVIVLSPDGGTKGAAAGLFAPVGTQPTSLVPPCPASTVTAQVVAVGAGV